MKKAIFLLILPWHLLAWSDFKGKPDMKSIISASSNTVISWQYEYDKKTNLVSNIYATPEFDPEKSWTKTDDPLVLEHEQGHLNLCKIICNEIFLNVNPSQTYTLREWIKLKIKYEQEWSKLDDIYDEKTDHSRNRQAQAKWNSWIAEQLKK